MHFLGQYNIQDEAHKVLQSYSTQTIDHIQKCFRQKFQCSRRPSYSTTLFFYRWRRWSFKVDSTFLNGTMYFFFDDIIIFNIIIQNLFAVHLFVNGHKFYRMGVRNSPFVTVRLLRLLMYLNNNNSNWLESFPIFFQNEKATQKLSIWVKPKHVTGVLFSICWIDIFIQSTFLEKKLLWVSENRYEYTEKSSLSNFTRLFRLNLGHKDIWTSCKSKLQGFETVHIIKIQKPRPNLEQKSLSRTSNYEKTKKEERKKKATFQNAFLHFLLFVLFCFYFPQPST